MNVDDIHDVVAVLRRRLEPVERAELLSDTIEGLHPLARKAAVLIGFFEREGEPTLIFIRRASTLRSHGGEIAFPGGGVEPADSSLVMAALREADGEQLPDYSGGGIFT
ncbi:MAG: NUDIX domain-containing protein [Chloroflexi bacterium]|nr:MAG: NUDIX domain-containing protein [Chloroflexota bacterium]